MVLRIEERVIKAKKMARKDYIENYWNHNTAYHKWILAQLDECDRVLDVGCGDGLLVSRLAEICDTVIGVDTHQPSIEKARQRLKDTTNAEIVTGSFEDLNCEDTSFDAVIFVASIHHMDFELCVKKSKELLKPGGKLLIVGLTKPKSVLDWFWATVRLIPARVGDLFHEVTGDVGAPITEPKTTMKEIRRIVKKELPTAQVRNALYYRYLLFWQKSY